MCLKLACLIAVRRFGRLTAWPAATIPRRPEPRDGTVRRKVVADTFAITLGERRSVTETYRANRQPHRIRLRI